MQAYANTRWRSSFQILCLKQKISPKLFWTFGWTPLGSWIRSWVSAPKCLFFFQDFEGVTLGVLSHHLKCQMTSSHLVDFSWDIAEFESNSGRSSADFSRDLPILAEILHPNRRNSLTKSRWQKEHITDRSFWPCTLTPGCLWEIPPETFFFGLLWVAFLTLFLIMRSLVCHRPSLAINQRHVGLHSWPLHAVVTPPTGDAL